MSHQALSADIRRAQDVARAALAKMHAIEAIGEIDLGLAKR